MLSKWKLASVMQFTTLLVDCMPENGIDQFHLLPTTTLRSDRSMPDAETCAGSDVLNAASGEDANRITDRASFPSPVWMMSSP
jgi:hypothetical protein